MKVGLMLGLIVEAFGVLTIPWQSGPLELTPPDSVAQFLFDTSGTPGPFTFITFEFQPANSISYYYFEASYSPISAPPQSPQDMKNRFIDFRGFELRNNQSLLLDKDFTKPSLYLYITVFGAPLHQKLLYNIKIRPRPSRPCPNRCSDIPQACGPSGNCSCPSDRAGYDCSIQLTTLEKPTDSASTLRGFSSAYFKLPSSNSTEQLQLTFTELTSPCDTRIYYRHAACCEQNPLSVFQYDATQKVSEKGEITVDPDSRDFWVMLLNNGAQQCKIGYSLKTTVNKDIVSISTIIIIVFSATTLLAILGVTIYLVRKRLLNATIHAMTAAQSQQHLEAQILSRYFPSFQYRLIDDKSHQPGDPLRRECNICLQYFSPATEVRIVYCNHIFHAQCLKEWFDRAQNCPVCRGELDKNSVKHYFIEVFKYVKKRDGVIKREWELAGDKLAIGIWEMHQAKSVMKSIYRDMPSSDNLAQNLDFHIT